MGLKSELFETAIEAKTENSHDESWPLIVGLSIILIVVIATVLVVRAVFKYLKRAKEKLREKL